MGKTNTELALEEIDKLLAGEVLLGETKKNKQKKYTKEERRNINLKHRYGITTDEFNEIIKSQGYKCKCCGTEYTLENQSDFCVDHPHNVKGRVTKKDIRGIICRNCNVGLGHFKDNPLMLNQAAVYLMKNGFAGTFNLKGGN